MSRSDLVLLAYVFLIVPAMLVGFVFARRKMFEPYHKFTMTAITIVNWFLIFFVMLGTYQRDVAPQVPHNLSLPSILIPTLHLAPGLIAQLLATYLVIRMWFDAYLPNWFKVNNIKPYMRLTLGLWLTTAVLGVFTWAVINKGLFASAPPPAPTNTASDATSAVVNLIGGNKFDPAELTIPVGTTIEFVNADTRSHTVTAEDNSFASGDLKAGTSFSHTFTSPGDFAYFCDYHGDKGHVGMAAVIHVTQNGSASSPTQASAAPTDSAPTAESAAPTATGAASASTSTGSAEVTDALKALVVSAQDTPANTAYVVGAQSQMAVIKAQAAVVTDALKQAHYEDAQAAAEAILNAIDGEGKDRDNDGKIQQLGDSYGLRKYIFSINETADTLESDSTSATLATQIASAGRDAITSLQTVVSAAQALLDAKTLIAAREAEPGLIEAVSKLDSNLKSIVTGAAALGVPDSRLTPAP